MGLLSLRWDWVWSDLSYLALQEFLIICSLMREGDIQSKLGQIFRWYSDTWQFIRIIFRAFDREKRGFISKLELIKIVEHLFHLIPNTEKEQLNTPEKFADELFTEMDLDEVSIVHLDKNINFCSGWCCERGGTGKCCLEDRAPHHHGGRQDDG